MIHQNQFSNKLIASALFFAVVLGLPTLVAAQGATTGDISVTVEERAITLTAIDGLSFGTILAFGRDGWVDVNPTGSSSVNSVFQSAPGAPGTFSATGVNNAPYSITLPANDAVVVTSQTDPTDSMFLRNWSRTGGTSQLFFDGNGDAFFAVGARLQVNARQPAGLYTGTYNVTVDYN